MAKIALIGAGSIGGVIASLLQQAGHTLLLCTRRPLAGLLVDTPTGETLSVTGQNLTDPAAAHEAPDWIVVATKAYDVEATAQWLQHLRAPETPVAILQNGVEHVERFAPFVPVDRIVPVIVDCPVERTLTPGGPDRIRQRGTMHLKAPDTSLGRAFLALFASTPADAVAVPDLPTVAWRKLCHNAVGVLPALLLRPTGVLRNPALAPVALDLVRECIAVARAEGAVLSDSVADEVLAAYRAAAPDGVNSLHADRLANRPMEIDARNGAIVRIGARHGIPTPANRMAVALLEVMTAPPHDTPEAAADRNKYSDSQE